MAARDVKLYLSLKKAIKEKVANPALDFNLLEVDGGLKAYDYDYIFQVARRVFPQKYNLGHSYLHQTPISNLERDDLRALNMEYAQDIVKAWGGTDETQINQRELDPVLVEYENELTAPDEHDSVYDDLNAHAIEQPDQSAQEGQQSDNGTEETGESGRSSAGGHSQPPRVYHPPQRPSLSPEMEAKLNQANRSMQEAKKRLASENPPQPSQSAQDKLSKAQRSMQRPPQAAEAPLSEKMSQRLNSATRMRPTGPLERPTARVRAGRTGVVSRANRRPVQAAEDRLRRRAGLGLLGRGAGSGGWGLSPLLSRWGWNLARGAARLLGNLASNLVRGAFNLGSRALAQLLPRVGMQVGMGAARAGIGLAAPAAIAVALNPLTWVIVALTGLFIFINWYDNFRANSECNKPTGEMRLTKRQGGIGSLEVDSSKIEAAVPNGQKIDFVIEASYQLACRTRTLSSVVVTDRVPEGTEYIEGSATSGFYQTNGEPIKGVYDPTSRTLTWSFTNFPMSNPVFIYFSVQPNASTVDTWVMNEATVRFTESGRTGTVPTGGGYPPTQDNCNGKYPLNNPIGNFGDPICDFDQDKLFAMLQQLDPENAAYWFTVVVPNESTYSPNAHNSASTSGRGAYGLFQMNPNRERTDTYDQGDVDWQRQVSNAINYNNQLASNGRAWCYWAAARDRWTPRCSLR